jgi:hypothetical protein
MQVAGAARNRLTADGIIVVDGRFIVDGGIVVDGAFCEWGCRVRHSRIPCLCFREWRVLCISLGFDVHGFCVRCFRFRHLRNSWISSEWAVLRVDVGRAVARQLEQMGWSAKVLICGPRSPDGFNRQRSDNERGK